MHPASTSGRWLATTQIMLRMDMAHRSCRSNVKVSGNVLYMALPSAVLMKHRMLAQPLSTRRAELVAPQAMWNVA
jgi:hypothetical protein